MPHSRLMGWGMQGERISRGGAMRLPPVAESRELSEWQRSVCNDAAPSARRTQGTATGYDCSLPFAVPGGHFACQSRLVSYRPRHLLSPSLYLPPAALGRVAPCPILCFLSCGGKKGRPPAGTGSLYLHKSGYYGLPRPICGLVSQ